MAPRAPSAPAPLPTLGRGGLPTHVPRPATPGEISDPRPAIPIDPGLPARPGPAHWDCLALSGPGSGLGRDCLGPDLCQDLDLKIMF